MNQFETRLKAIFSVKHGVELDIQPSRVVPTKKKPGGGRATDVKDKERGEDGFEEYVSSIAMERYQTNNYKTRMDQVHGRFCRLH